MSRITINPNEKKSTISRNLYGNFSEHLGRCIYNGLFVGKDSPIPNVNGMRTDVVEALKNIRLPVLRWPGGCFADEYHWKDGIGPQEGRKRMVNTHWGGVVEDNSFGTHEFLEFCRQVGCEPYINGNLGSGTVQEMSEWVEYMTFDGISPMAQLRAENGQEKPWKIKYFGVGNENWGCGGNMRPEYYADEFRRYQTYLRNYGGNRLYKIACGPNNDDYTWTDTVMKIAAPYMDGLSFHYYTVIGPDWDHKGSALHFSREEYYRTLFKALKIDEYIENHSKIMDRYDPEKRVGLIVDEWGTWFDVEPGTNPGFLYQQNTMRDALVAAASLNIFNRHSDRVAMANIAQMVNVLQAVLLTEGDKLVKTPTYHVFDLYREHHDATLVYSHVETGTIGAGKEEVPQISASVSVNEEGVLHATLANLSDTDGEEVELLFAGFTPAAAEGRVLAGKCSDFNDFDHPDTVQIHKLEGIRVQDGRVFVSMPACSVAELTIR
ncbi:MAG TPA: alpha-N-arabinofuranosidase [Candidatus Gallacutalibacter pullistercoris]|nr:alpha-N-arabinofuranosidase [Candidatus Gallacutalibacter pullistercoris]